jgi:outer membrane receptor protein involved in Fe transport
LRAASYREDDTTEQTLRLIDATVRSTFFPDAFNGGVTLALGTEYRWESIERRPGAVAVSGDAFGFNSVSGYQASSETAAFYGELLIPVVTPDMSIPGIYALEVTAALRYENTDVNGVDPNPLVNQFITRSFSSTDPRIAFRYQPIADLTLRGSYSTAFRAPSLSEFFASPSQDFPEIVHPITGLNQQTPMPRPPACDRFAVLPPRRSADDILLL